MRESDSPIKQDLPHIPHVAEREKTSLFFLNNVHKMERAGGGKGVGGLWVGEFPSKNACSYEENSQSVVGDVASCAY